MFRLYLSHQFKRPNDLIYFKEYFASYSVIPIMKSVINPISVESTDVDRSRTNKTSQSFEQPRAAKLKKIKLNPIKKIKSSLHSHLAFRVSRVSGAHLLGFAPGPTHQGCSSDGSLATCGRFDRLGQWNPYLPVYLKN